MADNKCSTIIHTEVEANPNADQPFGLGVFAFPYRARAVSDDGIWSYGLGYSKASAIADAARRIRDLTPKH